jgi:hypothetical protein
MSVVPLPVEQIWRIEPSRPDSGLGVQAKFLNIFLSCSQLQGYLAHKKIWEKINTFQVVPPPPGSGQQIADRYYRGTCTSLIRKRPGFRTTIGLYA